MITTDLLRSTFLAGLSFEPYIATGTPDQCASWKRIHDQAILSAAQRGLLESFTRQVNVLVLSGIWCGDCAQQCPLMARLAEASQGRIDLRLVDRDEHAALSSQLTICGGQRVPVAIFLSEDFQFCGLAGDRTLNRYRAVAARSLGPSCPLPGAPVPPEELLATMQDWLDEFERIHLMLRLSPRLRQLHRD